MTKSFWLGVIAALCAMSMFQDWLGMEAYLEFARSHWIVIPWWLWLVPIGVCIVLQVQGLSKEKMNAKLIQLYRENQRHRDELGLL